MKKLLPLLTFLVFISLTQINAQQVFDVVSIGSGYSNQSFYSMSNGEVSNIDNTDWDLAFQISGFQSSILLNSKNDVRLFKSGLHVNDWNNMSYIDTVNMLNSSNELYNSDTSWWFGAFNTTFDPNNAFDLGWGVYDFATHVVSGDSIYFLILPNNDVKKIYIVSLANSIYTFKYADVDGSNEITSTLDKTNFTNKNFGYYSFSTNTTTDREPSRYDWDLLFHQYTAVSPFVYKVTGVQSNDSVKVAKAYPAEYSYADPWGYPYSYHISSIGNDWKFFDLNTFNWVLEDSTVYFIEDRSGQIWKLMFTAFGGSSTGDYEFVKEPVSATGLYESDNSEIFGVYPNPNNGSFKLIANDIETESRIVIMDLNGKVFTRQNVFGIGGLQEIPIDITDIPAGVYMIHLVSNASTSTTRLMITK